MAINTYISIITLNINGLNAPIKRHRVADWITKQEPTICCLHIDWKVREWKKIFHANGNDKKVRLAILISDKIDFKTQAIKKGKEGHYIMIKGSIQEEDFTLVNINAPNVGAPK